MRIDFNTLLEYLENDREAAGQSRVAFWFNDLQSENELRRNSKDYWDSIPGEAKPDEYDESKILGKIYRDIKISENQAKAKTGFIIRFVNYVSKVAAVLFIPLLILFYIQGYKNDNKNGQIAFTEIYSPVGARTMFYLPDGTHGWLNGGSYLKFPEKFHGRTREVDLKGEAYFDVITNSRKPFIVSAKQLDIIATGTSFNVRAWNDVSETEVTLVEGKVDVYLTGNDEREKISSLSPGQLLYHVPSKTGTHTRKVNVEKYISWTEGRLIFRDDPFEEVVKRLNRWYNVNIVIKDEVLESYNYVATFEDETLDEILKMLTISAPIRYKDLKRTQKADGTFRKRTIELCFKPPKE